MTEIRFILSTPLCRLWHRIFCRHGHGIHSPFAYDLVRNVINERHGYYLYDEIGRRRSASDCGLGQKELELLYRLSLHRKPLRIAVVGEVSELEQWVLLQGADRKGGAIEQIETADLLRQSDRCNNHPEIDLLYLQIGNDVETLHKGYLALSSRLTPESVTIVSGIRHSPSAHRWFQRIRREHSHLSFDLFRLGLLYYNPTLTKGHHRVGY